MSFDEKSTRELRFAVGNLNLEYSFHTQTSVSFKVELAPRKAGRSWIDVHFPCSGHIKVQIRGALPEESLNSDVVEALIPALLHNLKIAADETYSVVFFKATNQIGATQPIDRAGFSDRIQTTESYQTPRE